MDYVALALSLLQSVLASAQIGGAAPDAVANIEAAVQALLAVEGTDVSFQQLEALRAKKTW